MEVPAFIDDMAAWNVTTLKLYVGTQRPIGRAVIELGHRRGMIVTAHLGAYSAQDAVEDGIDCLEHIVSVFNFSIPAETERDAIHRADLDLQNPHCRALVASLAERGVAVDPTLVVYRNMLVLPDLPEVQDHPDMKLAPAGMQRFWQQYYETHPLPQSTRDTRQREFNKYLELTGILYRAGVPLLAGSDAPAPFVSPGFSLHQELDLLVASGLTPAAALQAATLNNAKILKQAGNLGRIEPGMFADLVILRANPLADIRNTRQISSVIRGGRMILPESLQPAPNRE